MDLYMEVMSLIAGGVDRTSKIADKAGISQALCSSMLRKLENLSLVSEKKNAVINTKVLEWEIEDNFLSFWFRFIYPARRAVELDNAGPFLIETENGIDEFTGRHIVKTIREYIAATSPLAVKDYGFLEFGNPVEKKNEEIDFVAETSSSLYLFGEFKWKNSRVGVEELEDLKRKVTLVCSLSNVGGYYLVSKSGFTDALRKTADNDSKVYLVDGRTIFGIQ